MQKIGELNYLAMGFKEVEDMKEILSDVMLKTFEVELSETIEGLWVHKCNFNAKWGCSRGVLKLNQVWGKSLHLQSIDYDKIC